MYAIRSYTYIIRSYTRNVQTLLAHGHDDLGSLGMVAAEDDAVGAGGLDLLDDGGVVHRAGGHALEEHDVHGGIGIQELLV